jgi:high affinity Mn2+ porin
MDNFDTNSFAHDGRKDFFNWVNVAQGAFDYAADVRGYTWGAALEYLTTGSFVPGDSPYR